MKAFSLCIGAVMLTWYSSGCAAAVAALEAAAVSQTAIPPATTASINNVTLSEIFCDTAYGNRTPSNTPTSDVVWTWSTTSTIFGHKYIITVSPTTNQTIKTVRKTQTSTVTAQNTITNTITTTTTSTVTTLTTIPDSMRAVAPETTTVTRTIPTSKGFIPIQSQSKQSSWGDDQSKQATVQVATSLQAAVAGATSSHAAQARAVSIKARYEGASGTVVQNVTCCTQFFVWDTVASPDATTTITSHTGRVKTITTVLMSTTTVTKKLGPTTTTLTATSTGLTTTTSTVSPSAASSSTSTSDSTSPAAASSSTTSTPSPAAAVSSPSGSDPATPVRHAINAADVSPAPTATVFVFAQCQPNNMLSTLAHGAAYISSTAAGAKASALVITGIHTPHACCVACAKQHNCAGFAFEPNVSRCALYLSPNCADPGASAWMFRPAEPPRPLNGVKLLTVGNGQCGVARKLGEK